MSVRVEGLEQAQTALKRLEYNARRRVVSAGVRAANAEAVKRARSAAPVDQGNLRRQIRASVRIDRKSGKVIGRVRPKATKTEKGKGHSKAAAYLHLVIRGTKPHGIGGPVVIGGQIVSRVQHPGARPNPFMDRAAQAAFTPSVAAFTRKFREKMEAETKKVNTS